MSDNETERAVTFLQYKLDDLPGRFLIVRCVNEYATHWMNHEGAMVPLPEEDADIAQLFAGFAENPWMLPEWSVTDDN